MKIAIRIVRCRSVSKTKSSCHLEAMPTVVRAVARCRTICGDADGESANTATEQANLAPAAVWSNYLNSIPKELLATPLANAADEYEWDPARTNRAAAR